MAKQPERKPRGWGRFAELAKRLVQVPKEEVTDEKPKAKRKKK